MYTSIVKRKSERVRSYEVVPVEIWKHIITLTIDDSLLLSTSPFDYDWPSLTVRADWACPMYTFDNSGVLYWGIYDQPAMKQFRQIRATLRSVCRGWKELVDSPYIEHRCMRFCIPTHPDEDQDSRRVVLARRIEVISPPEMIDLPECVLGRVIKHGEKLNAEILLDIGGSLFSQILPAYKASLPSLKTLMVDFQNSTYFPSPSHPLETTLPNLHFLTALILRLRSGQTLDNETLCQFVNLTTLSISRPTELPHLDFSKWRFTLLQHLELEHLCEPGGFTLFFQHIRPFSRHLRYLRLVPCRVYYVTRIDIYNIWDCYELERLEMPLNLLFMWEGEPQKLSRLKHVVHTAIGPLSLIGRIQCKDDFMQFYGCLLRFCLQLRSLRVVTDSHDWPLIFQHADEPLPSGDVTNPKFHEQQIYNSMAAVTMVIARKIHGISLRYEDKKRRTMMETKAQLRPLN